MFYTYNQNNSGGSFDFQKDAISHYVIIEADNAAEADFRAEQVGVYFDPGYEIDCDCCGSRWNEAWSDDGTETPQVYGNDVTSGVIEKGQFGMKWMGDDPEGYVHYKDGRVQEIDYAD